MGRDAERSLCPSQYLPSSLGGCSAKKRVGILSLQQRFPHQQALQPPWWLQVTWEAQGHLGGWYDTSTCTLCGHRGTPQPKSHPSLDKNRAMCVCSLLPGTEIALCSLCPALSISSVSHQQAKNTQQLPAGLGGGSHAPRPYFPSSYTQRGLKQPLSVC